MPFVSSASMERIRELENLLRESVPVSLYNQAQARIAVLERRVDWQADMLLRRGQSLPLPPEREEKPKDSDAPPTLSESELAWAQTVIDEGKRLGRSAEEIEDALRQSVGNVTERDIARAIAGREV
jgi:hypothetical protein